MPRMPKYAEAVIQKPPAAISSNGFTRSTSAAGNANMATPTPNQPICVRLINRDGRREPATPKERRANKSNERPVPQPIYPKMPVYTARIMPPERTEKINSERSRPLPMVAPTDMLAEKNVKPSMIKNMDQKDFLAYNGTGSKLKSLSLCSCLSDDMANLPLNHVCLIFYQSCLLILYQSVIIITKQSRKNLWQKENTLGGAD